MIREIVDAFAAGLSAPQALNRGAGEAPDLVNCAKDVVRDFSAALGHKTGPRLNDADP